MATEVNAPMVGKILRVVANVGDRVEEDETIVVMEAMKMEIEVVAPEAGVVSEIRVADGDAVGGQYCQDCQVAPIDDAPGIRVGVMSSARDPERAKLLWAKSEELVSERF